MFTARGKSSALIEGSARWVAFFTVVLALGFLTTADSGRLTTGGGSLYTPRVVSREFLVTLAAVEGRETDVMERET